MDNSCWALQEAIRIVTVLDIVAHCQEIDDIDLAGVVDDLDRRDNLDPTSLYLEILESRSLIDAMLDDDTSFAPARDAVRDIAREHADAAQSAARRNQRNTSNHYEK